MALNQLVSEGRAQQCTVARWPGRENGNVKYTWRCARDKLGTALQQVLHSKAPYNARTLLVVAYLEKVRWFPLPGTHN